MEFDEQRIEYQSPPLELNTIEKNDPMDLFKLWMQEAIDASIIEPNAMVLATASKTGVPGSRVVLLKEINHTGLMFYTQYRSRKGAELEENPQASVTFYWKELRRQISIDGTITKLSKEKNLSYFKNRPRGSQIGAWCSEQGAAISSRSKLQEAFEYYERLYADREIPMPPYWGGYLLTPFLYLFWQGNINRLHDRFRYIKEGSSWALSRISP